MNGDEVRALASWMTGALFATRRAIETGSVPGLDSLDGARIVIQGYGNAGSIAATLFREAGAAIVGVSDSSGAIYSDEGLDPVGVSRHKKQTGSVVGCKGTKNLSNSELLHLPCDVLIPAAFENQIRGDNVAGVNAKVVVEAANGPTSSPPCHTLPPSIVAPISSESNRRF